MISELRTIILQLKPTHPLPDLLASSTSSESVLLPSAIAEHQAQSEEAAISQQDIMDGQQQQASQNSGFFPGFFK